MPPLRDIHAAAFSNALLRPRVNDLVLTVALHTVVVEFCYKDLHKNATNSACSFNMALPIDFLLHPPPESSSRIEVWRISWPV